MTTRASAHLRALALPALLSLAFGRAEARPNRVDHVPSGRQLSCLTCHLSSQGGAVNGFGFDAADTLINGTVQWAQLCELDSDLDGFSNGVELGDSACVWRIGDGVNPDGVRATYPGDPQSYPREESDMGLMDMGVMDMGVLDMSPPLDMALPDAEVWDAEVWDAWLEQPEPPDAFSVQPLDMALPDMALPDMALPDMALPDMALEAGVEVGGETSAGEQAGAVEAGAQAGEQAGQEPPPANDLLKERSLLDPSCAQASAISLTPFAWLMLALFLLRRALTRSRHKSAR